MRSAVVFCLIGLIAFAHCLKFKNKNSKPAQEFELKRQPLVSPEGDHSWGDYKRIKRENGEDADTIAAASTALKRFQDFVLNCKADCGAKLNFQPNEIEKPLLHEENPTPREKCLMACVLEQTKIMSPENKISIDTIARLASLISNKNELVIAIARATAENCNRSINTADKCEAASQINRCIARGLRAHRIQIVY